jgi:hypothetical protein
VERGCSNQCAAQGGSSGAREAATGVNWFETQAEGRAHRVAPMADGGACMALARGEKGGFYSRLEAVGRYLRAKTAGQGMGGGMASTVLTVNNCIKVRS